MLPTELPRLIAADREREIAAAVRRRSLIGAYEPSPRPFHRPAVAGRLREQRAR